MAEESTRLHPLVKEASKKLKPKLFNTQLLKLTPDQVTRISESGSKKKIKIPGLFSPRYEYSIHPENNAIAITTQNWGWKWQYRPEIEKWTTGIYQGGVHFPLCCVVCMKPVKKHELVELSVLKKTIGKIQIQNVTQQEADLMFEAWWNDRYWYPIPFCKDHNLQSGALALKNGNIFKFGFSNPEYGKEFGKLNQLKGGWFSSKDRFRVKFLMPFLITVGFFTTFTGGLLAYRGAKGQFGKAAKTAADLPVGIALCIAGLALAVVMLIQYNKKSHGTDLNV